MIRARQLVFSLLIVLCSGMWGCGACGTPSGIMVDGASLETFTISWQESNAMGLYVVAPEAKLPGGPNEPVEGPVFWVVESTSFPGGFESPVRYGEIPSDAKDATAEHGGPEGPAPLECGVVYKVAVVALRGTDEIMVEWDCEE